MTDVCMKNKTNCTIEKNLNKKLKSNFDYLFLRKEIRYEIILRSILKGFQVFFNSFDLNYN